MSEPDEEGRNRLLGAREGAKPDIGLLRAAAEKLQEIIILAPKPYGISFWPKLFRDAALSSCAETLMKAGMMADAQDMIAGALQQHFAPTDQELVSGLK